MAVSDFRMSKFMYLFNCFFDTNRSGAIDKKDFDMAAENICKVRGWSSDDPNHEKTKQVLNSVWKGLQEKADADKDEQVTCEEWCKMWEEYSRNPDAVLDWQLELRDFMFQLEDTSGDGAIDEEEFAIIFSSYKVSEEIAREAFKKLSSNGSVEITRDKFSELWIEYFQSDDPSAPGNFIFGVTKFE